MANPMKFSQALSLALHGLAFVAAADGDPVRIRDISQRLGASEAHLHKVFAKLVRCDLVQAIRGPRGGYCLKRSAEDIYLIEVYECIEGKIEISGCLLSEPVCSGNGCVLSAMVSEVNKKVHETFSNTALVELLAPFASEKKGQGE